MAAAHVPLAPSVLSPRPLSTPRLSYQQELWGGLELAEKRVEEGRKTYREVQSFIEEMIDLELAYVKGFKKLSARQTQCTEGGTLGSAWQAFRKYLHINADMHALLMEHWRKASFALQDHCAQQTKTTTNYFAEAAKLNKEREKGLADVLRLKGRYYKVAREAELAKQQYEGAQNDSSIPTTKLVKLNAALQAVIKECETSEKLYAKAVEDFNTFQGQHVQEMQKILHSLEAMEESRIATLKSIFEEGCVTWSGSFTHQPEALGAVQKIIKNIDGQKDVQNWILGNRTGQPLPAPLVVEPWQPAAAFRRDRSSSGNSVRFRFKPDGAGTVIVGTTSGIVPTTASPSSPTAKRRGEEAEGGAEKEKTAEREEPVAGSTALPRVRVLYPYEAEDEGELSIQPGEVITVLEVEDEGWWRGQIDGRVGVFPSNYVRAVSADDSAGGDDVDSNHSSGEGKQTRQPPQQHGGVPIQSRSLADFRASLPAGDLASPPLSPSSSYTSLSTSSPSLLMFLEQQQQQHVPSPPPAGGQGSKGKQGGKLIRTGGMRRIIKGEEPDDDDAYNNGDSYEGQASGGSGEVTPVSVAVDLERPRVGTLPAPVPVPGSMIMTVSPLASPTLAAPQQEPPTEEEGFPCVVLFDFEAENEDELTIRAGEVLRVMEEVEQWYVGMYPDGRTGMFPSNYVRRTDGL